VLIDVTITYLEMTRPEQLVPGRLPPAPVKMERCERGSAALLRSTYDRIGTPHNWIGRSGWSEGQWEELLARREVQPWLAWVDQGCAGMVELEVQPCGDVEITVFGLVPEFVDKGYGGHVLTLGTQLAWRAKSPEGEATRRVWLHTSSLDHPHAMPNYERRGFRPFRTKLRRREIP
jgi:GNAT superfamily N-acetyltransferase